jgi:uncharacterized protein (TIGR02996 family)
MSKFVTDLNSVLKYQQEQERQAFEKAIDANPLESTNHLVYADWLDEQGEPEEAAFRRSMGEWMQDTSAGKTSLRPEFNRDFLYPWRIALQDGRQRYPKGVGQEFMLPSVAGDISPTTPSDHPRMFHGHYNWKAYRHMESALRKAFQAGRQNTSA